MQHRNVIDLNNGKTSAKTTRLGALSLTLMALFSTSVSLAAESSSPASPSREPANVVVPVPESTVPRSAVRESDKDSPVAPTAEADEEHLTGNWGGVRKSLSDRGIDLAIIFKQELGRNVSGGLEIGNYALGNLDLRAAIDTEKLGLWKNGSFFFYGLFNDGSDPSHFVGDNQVTSNIEAPAFMGRLYESWYQHAFADGKASLLIGLHDLNSEFYVTDSSTVLLNSSFGVGRELSQTGANGPSIFPVTAPAIRFRAEPSKDFYLQAAAFNAVAGSPDDRNGTHIRVSPDDGLLLISEVGFLRTAAPKPESEGDSADSENLGKIAFGTWAYTRTVPEYTTEGEDPETAKSVTSSGTYVLIDQAVTKRISIFARAGFSTGEAYEVESDLAAGLTARGLLPGRESDLFSIAATSVGAATTFRSKEGAAGTEVASRETTFEVTYRAQLYRGVFLQPDYQYIDHPSFSSETSSAQTIGARLELNF